MAQFRHCASIVCCAFTLAAGIAAANTGSESATGRGAATVSAQGAQTSSADQTSSRANLHKPDDTQQATGVVNRVDCASGWQLELTTPTGTLHLRAGADARVKILAPTGQIASDLHCEDLSGQHVTARFQMGNGHGRDATIESVQILASDASGTAGPLPENSSVNPPVSGGNNPAVKGLPGDQVAAERRVADVTCNGNDILIKVAVPEGQLTLHARDYTRLTYDDDRTAFEKRDFPACTDLKGRTASITYVVAEHRSYDGDLQSVEIEK